MLVFPGFWSAWPKFWAGISARMTPGCPRDVRPKTSSLGWFFVLERLSFRIRGFEKGLVLKFRSVTIRRAQPSARLSKEICVSLCGLSEGSAGVSPRALRGSAGFCGIFWGFSGVVILCLWPSRAVGVGGQRGLSWKKPFLCQRLRPLFCTFHMPPQEKEDTLLEKCLGCFWGVVCRQRPPANPFSKPKVENAPRAAEGFQALRTPNPDKVKKESPAKCKISASWLWNENLPSWPTLADFSHF